MERHKLKKAIIFDCDNTLWEGVVGEGDIIPDKGIIADIKFFAKRGVIIGICSKNNSQDVHQTSVMKELNVYISVKRINWKNKPHNMREIAKELNIGLDAIVFVDDMEFERSLMEQQLPEVLSIHPDELLKTVTEQFDLSGDMLKTLQYQQNYKRAKSAESFTDIDDFLASMNMVLKIRVNDESQIPRISELTQKTNQFNLTTIRYTEEQITREMGWNRVYSLSVTDKFGDNGLTGVCIVCGNFIGTFLLSCRILGRGIEYAFLDWVIKDLMKLGHKEITGRYRRTPKNKQVATFYSNYGFKKMNEEYFPLLFSENKYKLKPHFQYE